MQTLKYTAVRTTFIVLSGLVLLSENENFATASGDCPDSSEHPTLTPEYIAKFYTDTRIDGQHENAETCAKQVFNFRQKYNESTRTLGVKPTVGFSAALIIFVMVGVFAAGIAQAFQMVRRYIYHDADNLDTAFDAGGKVSIGLTATTIVSQWTWSATLLQSSTVASKYGISGPYWYAGGATIQIILFSVLSIMLKTRAPGAKTFLQVILFKRK